MHFLSTLVIKVCFFYFILFPKSKISYKQGKDDVGLANLLALNQAVSCYQACHFIGMREWNVVLAQCVAYLALLQNRGSCIMRRLLGFAPKSIAIYLVIVMRDGASDSRTEIFFFRDFFG